MRVSGIKGASQSLQAKMGHDHFVPNSKLAILFGTKRIAKQSKSHFSVSDCKEFVSFTIYLPYIILWKDSGYPEKSQSMLGQGRKCAWPLSPQMSLHEKPNMLYCVKNGHVGSGVGYFVP